MLFAEDDDDFRSSVSEGLRFFGFRVREFANGSTIAQAALEDEAPPFVIVTDLKMPKSSGYDLLARLDRESLLEIVPVVVLSAVPDPTIEDAVVLTKPVDIEKFATLLDEQLRRAKAKAAAARLRLRDIRRRRARR